MADSTGIRQILIIEDDREINDLLVKLLRDAGFKTESAFNGLDGIACALNTDYHLILLDMMLPYKSGDEVIRKVRASKSTPIIVLSAKDAIHTKVDAIQQGADDYLVKPFDIDELLVRIEAVLRRCTATTAGSTLSYRDIHIDCDAKRVHIAENEVKLTATEYAILELLLENPDKIFSKRNLFESIFADDHYWNDDTINVHMSNLRHKLDEKGVGSAYIETVYGMGYRLVKN